MLKQNYSYIEASRSLGIGESALRGWVDQVPQERQGVTAQSGSHAYKRATVERLGIPNTLNHKLDVPAPNQV